MGTPTSEGFLCILMLLALSADESLSSVHDAIVSGLLTATSDCAYTSANIVDCLDYEQQAHSMAITQTVPILAEAHIACSSCSSDSKQTICSNCKKPWHTSEFCIQPGGGMAGKTIAEAQQAHNAKWGKKPKDKMSKPAGSIIQSGNQAYIVDADGKAHEIISSSSSAPTMTTAPNSMHFFQTDNISWIDPLILESMCTADFVECMHIGEISWLTTQDSLHASIDWHERRRNAEDLDLTAVMAAPLPTSFHQMTLSLDTSPFLPNSTCMTHILPDCSDFMMLHPITDRTVTGIGSSTISALGIGTIKLIIAKGSYILLENVLFIPTSTVHLISFGCITESLQCSVTFDTSTVTLKN